MVEGKEDRDQRLVHTPYGDGLVVRTRKEADKAGDIVYEVQLVDWSMATSLLPPGVSRRRERSRPPTLFTSQNPRSIAAEVGMDVMTPYGRGTVVAKVPVPLDTHDTVNATQHESKTKYKYKYTVELTAWRLSGRNNRVKCFLWDDNDVDSERNPTIQVVRKRTKAEMDVWERVDHSRVLKQRATVYFRNKQHAEALRLYAEAVQAVRYLQSMANLTNDLRADLVELSVTCHNNAATCCLKLDGRAPEAAVYAQNAYLILEALEQARTRQSKVYRILTSTTTTKGDNNNIDDTKLFVEWKCKSLLLMAKSAMDRKDYETSLRYLKVARTAMDNHNNNNNNSNSSSSSSSNKAVEILDREVKKLTISCVQKKKAVDKVERQRAKAMFGGGGGGATEEKTVHMNGKTTVNTTQSTTTTTTTSAHMNGNMNGSTNTTDTDTVTTTTTSTKTHSRPPSVLRKRSTDAPSCGPKESQFVEEMPKERRVTWDETIDDDDDDDDDELPWYSEHKEAIILAGGVLATAALFLLRPRK